MSDNLKDILARAKEGGATQSQMLALIELYSKKKDSSESPSTGEEETTSTASTQEVEPQEIKRPAAPNWIKDIRNGAPLVERGVKLPKRGEQTEGEKAAQERKERVEESTVGQLSEEERAASDYTEYESIYDEAGVPEELRKEDLFGGAGLVLGKFALEDAARARRANNVSKEYEDLFEEKTVSRSFVSGLGDFQAPQKIAPKAESMTESELQAAKEDVARRMNEIMGFDMMNPYEETKQRVYDQYDYNKGILSEISLEKAKDEWRADKAITTKGEVLLGSAFGLDDFFEGIYGAVVDPVVHKVGANAAVAFFDATGQGEKAEQVLMETQQMDVKNMLDVGLDPNDQRGITETFNEGETGLAALKALYFGSQSVGLMAATIAQPEIGLAMMAMSSGLDTYTGFRDRLDMSAEDKAMLAISAGAAEVFMGKVLGGLGNVRRFRSAIGISDDIGKASMIARKDAYNKALDFLEPLANKVKSVKSNPALRAGGRFVYDTTGEAIEELAVEATNQFMAHAIAGEEFDAYALADAALLGGAMGGGMGVFTARKVYGIESHLYNKPLKKDMDKYEEIQTMYSDLKEAARSEKDPAKKKIILEEAKKLRAEGLELVDNARKAYDKLDVNEKANLVEVNKKISGAIQDVKNADNATLKTLKKKELARLLVQKATIETKAGVEIQLDAEQQAGIESIESQENVSGAIEAEGVPLQTAIDMVQELKAKRDARIEEAAKRSDKSKPSTLINKRVRFLNPATNETVEGVLIKDGQRLAVETDGGNIIDIDSYERSSERPLGELGLSVAESIIRPNEDGSFTYNASGGAAPQGSRMVNNNGVRAIRRNNDGSVKNVTLTSPDGSVTYNLKGEDAEEAAYQILMKERQTPEGAAKVDEEFRKDAEARTILQQEAQRKSGGEQAPAAQETEAEPEQAPKTIQERITNIDRLPPNAQEAVVRMLGAIIHLSPNHTIEVLNTNEEVKAKWTELGGENTARIKGFNDPKTNTIYISREGTLNDRRSDGLHILQHEMIHPILNAIISTDPVFFEKVYNQGLDLILNAKNNRVAQLIYAHASQYKGDKFKEELLVEFFNFMSNESNLQDVLKEQPNLKTKIINFLNSIIERLGIPYQIKFDTPNSEILQLLGQIRDGFASGTPVDVSQTEKNRSQGLQAYKGRAEADIYPITAREANSILDSVSGKTKAFFKGVGSVSQGSFQSIDVSGVTKPDTPSTTGSFIGQASEFLAEHPVVFLSPALKQEIGDDSYQKLIDTLVQMGYSITDKSVGVAMAAPAFNDLQDGTSNLETIEERSFLSDESIESIAEFDPEAVKDINVIDSVGKMLGADIRYIYNTQMNVASGYLKPNSVNKLSEPVVVVNLAKAKGDSTMFGLSAFMVEKLRKAEGSQRSGSASSYLNSLEAEIREASNKLESNPELLTDREKNIMIPLLFRMQSYLDQTSQYTALDTAGVAGSGDGKTDRSKLGNALIFAITEQISKDLSNAAFSPNVPLNGIHTEIEQAFLDNINQGLDVDIDTVRGIRFADFLKLVFVDKALDSVKSKPKSTTFGKHARTILKYLATKPKEVQQELKKLVDYAFVGSLLPKTITTNTFKTLQAMAKRVALVKQRKDLEKEIAELSDRNQFKTNPPTNLSVDSLNAFGAALLDRIKTLSPTNVSFQVLQSRIESALNGFMSIGEQNDRQSESYRYEGRTPNDPDLLVVELEDTTSFFNVFLSAAMNAENAKYVAFSVLPTESYQAFESFMNSESLDMNSSEFVSFIQSLNAFQRRAVFGAIAYMKPQLFAEVIKPYVDANYANIKQATLVTEEEFDNANEYDSFFSTYSDFRNDADKVLAHFDSFLESYERGFTNADVNKTFGFFNVDRNLHDILAVSEDGQFNGLDIFGNTTMDNIYGDSSKMSNMLLYSNMGQRIANFYFSSDTSFLDRFARSPINYIQTEQEVNDWLKLNNQGSSESDYTKLIELREQLSKLREETEYYDMEFSLRQELQIDMSESKDLMTMIENKRSEISHLMDKFNDPNFDAITIEDQATPNEKIAEIEAMSEEEVIKNITQTNPRDLFSMSSPEATRARRELSSESVVIHLPDAPVGYQYAVYSFSMGTSNTDTGMGSVEFSVNFDIDIIAEEMRKKGMSEEEISRHLQERSDVVQNVLKGRDFADRLGTYDNVPRRWGAGKAMAGELMKYLQERVLRTGNTGVTFSPAGNNIAYGFKSDQLISEGIDEDWANQYGYEDAEENSDAFGAEFRRLIYNTWAARRMGDSVLITKNQVSFAGYDPQTGQVYLLGRGVHPKIKRMIGRDSAKAIVGFHTDNPRRSQRIIEGSSQLTSSVIVELENAGIQPLTVEQMVELAKISGIAMSEGEIQLNPAKFAKAYSEKSVLNERLGNIILMPTTMTYLSTNSDGVLSTPPLTKESVISDSELQAYIDGKAEEQLLIEQMEDMRERNEKAILEATKSKWWTWDAITKAWVNRNQKLREALEKGLGAYTRSVLTRRNGAIRYADKLFKEYESKIFAGMTVGDEKNIDDIIYLRRVIQIDKNRDFKRESAQATLDKLEDRLKFLQENRRNSSAETRKDIDAEIKSVKSDIAFNKQYIEDNQRPKHPSSPNFDMEMNLENATKTLSALESRLGAKKFNELSQKADKFFDAFSDVLEMAYEAGLIDSATFDRFKNDDYAPRVFLEHFFGDSHTSMYQGTNLSEEYISSLKAGSNQEIFTDARMLLSMALRSVRAKAHQNELMSVMHTEAKKRDFEGVPFMKELNKNEAGTVEKADKGFVNVFYRVDGNLEGFQIESKLEPMLKGNVKDYVNIPPKLKALISTASGTSIVKLFATGTSTAFAVTAFLRFVPEVVFGRGVYDKKGKGFVPLMMSYAALDSLIGLKDAVFNPSLVEEYMKNGGATTWMAAMGKPKAVVRRGRKSLVSSALSKLGRSIVNVASFAGEKSELAVRLAIYSRTKKNLREQFPDMPENEVQSLAAEEALMLADFATSGTVSKTLDAISPYLNAGIQGFRGAASYASKNPKMFGSKISQMFTGSFAMYVLSMMSMDDDEWDRISDYKKQMNTMIPLGRDKDGNMRFLEIPRAHTFLPVTALAEVAARRVVRGIRGESLDFDESKHSQLIDDGSYIMDSFLKALPTPSLAPVVNLYIAYQHNWDTWRNGKIYQKGGNKDMQNYIEGQYDSKVRDFYKVLALEAYERGVDVSAKRMQVAVEKIIVGDKNLLVDKIYDFADAIALYGDRADKLRDKHGIVLTDETATKKAKDIITILGLKGRYYVTPSKSYKDSKRVKDIKEKENTEIFKQKQAVKAVAAPLIGKKIVDIPSKYMKEIEKIAGGDAMRQVQLIRYFLYWQRANLVDDDVIDISFSDNNKERVAKIEDIYRKPVKDITDYEFEQILRDLAIANMPESELKKLVIEFEKQKKQK